MRTTFLVLLGLSVSVTPTFAADLKASAPVSVPTEITRLVEQLGDAEFKTREAAAKRLHEIGQPALAPLEAATRSDVLEVSERAGQLLVGIRRRLDNEKALAPAMVELLADEQTVRALFEVIEKQTRYKLRVDGDTAVMTRKVKPEPGKRAFWEVVQHLCDATGLEVASVASNPLSLAMQEQQIRDAAARLDDTTKKLRLDVLRKNRAGCVELLKLVRAMSAVETDAANKASLAKQFAECEGRLAGIDADIAAFDPQDLPLGDINHGVVSLRAKSANGSRPWCAQAVRVEAEPASADTLKRHAADVLPIQLRVTPEPRLRWNGVTGVSVLKAVSADDREVRMHYPMPLDWGPMQIEQQMILRQRRMVVEGRPGSTAPPVPPVAVVPLVAPPGGAVAKLKSVEGFLRGTVWTDPEEVIAVQGPEAGKTTAAVPVNGTTLQVRVGATETNLGDNSVLVEVTLMYNPSEVRPDADRQTQEEVWLEQQNGRVRPLGGIQPADPNRTNTPDRPFGLAFTDPDGKLLALTRTSQSVQQRYSQQMQLMMYCTLRGYVRPNETGTATKIGSVAFRGSRLAEVTVPFKLTDVPVAPGTGDGKPLPEDNIYYKR